MTEEEISSMTLLITNTRRVDPEVRDAVIQEFYDMCLAQQYISEGGIDFARQILEAAIGPERAAILINKLSSALQKRPFEFIRQADSAQILNVIHNEHPQTIALVLSYIEPKQAAEILAQLAPDRQSDIVMRIAHMGAASSDYVHDAERILERKISSMGYQDQVAVGGLDAIVNVIQALDRTTEKRILESLDLHDGELAEDIRKRLFVFDDIIKLSNQDMQRVLKEVPQNDLAIALKGAIEEVKNFVFSNISSRMKEMLVDEMDVMGPIRVRDLEEAQQRIVAVVRRLEDGGEITISRGEGDDLIV
jgi:flagellar motor switch protein FliG